MKKLLILLAMLTATSTASAIVTSSTCGSGNNCTVVDCSSPTNTGTDSRAGFSPITCGYTNSFVTNPQKNAACEYIQTAGNNYTFFTIMNCTTQAPINSGLIFLIIAGVGAGSFMFMKKDKLEVKKN